MPDLTEKTLHTERKYTGKIISVDVLDIELPDGRKAKREVIRHGNARPLATASRLALRARATRRLRRGRLSPFLRGGRTASSCS